MHFSSSRWWQAVTQVILCCMLLSSPTFASAQQSAAQVRAVKLEPAKPPLPKGWTLSAEFGLGLGDKLREAVERGLPLQFAVDFKLLKPRWYWADEEVVSASYPFNLSYHALTRTYRLVTPSQTLTFNRLEDAVEAMSKVAQWPVIQKDAISVGEKYNAKVRFRLVLTEMPKPFQISALVNTEWDLSTEWLEFEFTPHSEILR